MLNSKTSCIWLSNVSFSRNYIPCGSDPSKSPSGGWSVVPYVALWVKDVNCGESHKASLNCSNLANCLPSLTCPKIQAGSIWINRYVLGAYCMPGLQCLREFWDSIHSLRMWWDLLFAERLSMLLRRSWKGNIIIRGNTVNVQRTLSLGSEGLNSDFMTC